MKTTTVTSLKLIQSILTVCIFTSFGIAQNTLSIEVGDGNIDVLYNSDSDIGGFQFTVEGATVTGASGGDAAANGFMLSCSPTMCLGFSMTGGVIPAGSGTLVVVAADITGDVSLTGIVVSDAVGSALDFSFDDGGGSSVSGCTDDTACNYNADVTEDDGSCYYDEAGCTASISDDCEAAGGVTDYTFEGCVTIATSDEFLASCEALGVGESIEQACIDAGGPAISCSQLAGIYEQAFSGDCEAAIASATSGDPNTLCLLAGDIAEDTYDSCDDLAASGCAQTCADPADYIVEAGSYYFNPQNLNIAAGETVEWYNAGGFHDVNGVASSITGESFNNPEEFSLDVVTGPATIGSFTFTIAGLYQYDCSIGSHAANGMVGSITVGAGGCTDDMACNYDAGADFDDGSCLENDCAGECGGSAEVDECGVCGGDGSSCASSIIDIFYNTTTDIGGFQFNVDGVTVLGASGGAAADAGFTISTGGGIVLAFSFSGATIPAGSGVLVQVEVDGNVGAACLSAVVLSDPAGVAIENEVTDCLTISQLEILLGCMDDTACNYDENATEDDGSCTYAEENYDCDGNCTAQVDCNGVCGGDAVEDECGVCDGPGIGHDCDCDGNVEDCAGQCGGSAVEDECGVCGGDGTSCIPVQLGFGVVADGNMEITYDSPADIAGFQFNITGVNITSASGGAAGGNGFMISNSSSTVIAFSLTGATIPAGSGVLIELGFEATAEQACVDSPVISDPNGEGLDIEIGACVGLDFSCIDDDDDGICDDVDDCVGAYDECGVCNGDGIDEGACDCDGNVEDCAGECGGSAVEDECGVCGGDGIDEGACDCDGNVEDCAGECGGSAEIDECGECGGDGIDEGACDCDGNVEDCAGECGGSAIEDCAGVCGGSAENCPDWQDDPGGYQFVSFLVAGIVLNDGVQLGDEGDQFAAFDGGGNVRGVAVQLTPGFGPYAGTTVYEMTMRSNADGDVLSFQYYDASNDEILDISETYTFATNEQLGNLVAGAVEFNVENDVDLSIDLIAGYNWISFNVDVEDASLGSILASVSDDAIFMASQASGTATNYGAYGWYGSLATLENTQMYLLEMANAATLTITGVPSDASTPIDLIAGYNWIGYLPQNAGNLGTALASVSDNAIFMASQASGTATNYGAYGWYGSLTTMEPGNGYLLEMGAEGTLVYPEFDDGLAKLSLGLNKQEVILTEQISDWTFNYGDYRYMGAITLSVESRTDNKGDIVAAFIDGECRGIAERMDFPFDDRDIYIVQVYSNVEEGEELTFKYYDSVNAEIIEYTERETFKNFMNKGNGFDTVSLSREAKLSQPGAYTLSSAYPNPFNPVTSFEYTIPEDGMVQVAVYNINGRMVAELVNGYMSAGSYPVTWDANDLSSGVYMLHMISGDFSTAQKVMLLK